MYFKLIFTGVIVLIAYAIYNFVQKSAQYFKERNLKYIGFKSFIHTLYEVFTGKFDPHEGRIKEYNRFSDEPIIGVFSFQRIYYIRNPEAFKRIAIKDFDHFQDRDNGTIDNNVDDLLGNTLGFLNGEKWKQMRGTLSPSFTGSRMRGMFELIAECADDVVKHFMQQSKSGEKVNVEMKDVFRRYANDIIATCAFGIETNSFKNPENEFSKNGQLLLISGGILQGIKNIVKILLARYAKISNKTLMDRNVTDWFKSMVLETMAVRKMNNIHRPDMINIMMQVKDDSLNHQTDEKFKNDGFAANDESVVGKTNLTHKWSDNELIAQCFIFFIAGFETTSWALTYTAYELLVNPDIQTKLYEEIKNVNEQLNGNRITYDQIQKMKYLDQVISEALRKWPIAMEIGRVCVKDYNYNYDDDDGMKFTIEKGSSILFPIFAIQRDPNYFPNPNKFDPERFNDENKHKIKAGSYAPFGIGPRNCIGSRFALMEIKVIFYYLLLNFSLKPNKDSQIPLKFKRSFIIATEKGVNLELKPRNI